MITLKLVKFEDSVTIEDQLELGKETHAVTIYGILKNIVLRRTQNSQSEQHM